jgi:AcrR family transcriptional regulator
VPRPAGSRNADFEETRAGLLRAIRAALSGERLAQASLRELAAAAGASVATLRHYFGSREGVIAACLAELHAQGKPYLLEVAAGATGDAATSLRWLVQQVLAGLRLGVGDVHALGLHAGMGNETLGPAYVQEILEPTLQAVEARLARHVAAGELRPMNVRHAAIALISPVLVAWLHQAALGGARCRPLDLAAFTEDHVAAFLRAHGA